MKSKERIEKERESRKTLLVLLAGAFILLLLVSVMVLSFTGGQDAPARFAQYALNQAQEVASDIWFKIDNFLQFLK